MFFFKLDVSLIVIKATLRFTLKMPSFIDLSPDSWPIKSPLPKKCAQKSGLISLIPKY
jgi:hypothetical protein